MLSVDTILKNNKRQLQLMTDQFRNIYRLSTLSYFGGQLASRLDTTLHIYTGQYDPHFTQFNHVQHLIFLIRNHQTEL